MLWQTEWPCLKDKEVIFKHNDTLNYWPDIRYLQIIFTGYSVSLSCLYNLEKLVCNFQCIHV